MKKIKTSVVGTMVVVASAVGTSLVGLTAGAQVDAGLQATGQDSSVSIDPAGTITAVVNWMLFAVGAISVIMLIWGGIKYSTSAGDTAKVTSAKNTIMYAVIGLVVALLAYAIVQFVSGTLISGGGLQGPGFLVNIR